MIKFNKIPFIAVVFIVFGIALVGYGGYEYYYKQKNITFLSLYFLIGILTVLYSKVLIAFKKLKTKDDDFKKEHLDLHKQVFERIDNLQKIIFAKNVSQTPTRV